MSRPLILVLAGALVLAACSDAGDDASTPTVPPATTVPSTAPSIAAEPDVDAPEAESALAASAQLWTVAIDVTADGFDEGPFAAAVDWSGDPDAVVDDGPFGRYGSCSGLREHVGAYSVFVSGADAADAVGVWTADRVTGPGIFDAEVRVERAGRAPLTATGTVTILDGLQEGEFLAFGVDGGRIEGSFACTGAEPATPMAAADAGAAVDAVEVVALLRDGSAERVVGLAADGASGAECPAGGSGDTVLSVGDGAALGAITTFELDGSPSGSALLRVAGTDYEFPEVTVALDERGASGVFSGANLDGTSVDGAFHCT